MPKNLSTEHAFLDSFFDSHAIVRPKRDWMILVTFFIVVIISVIAFDANMYLQIRSGDMYVSVNKDELIIEKLKASQLQAVINIYEARKEKIANAKVQKLVDPSI